MKKLICVLLSLALICTVFAGLTVSAELTIFMPETAGIHLIDATYIVEKDTTLTATGAGDSAIYVINGTNAKIIINEGCTLTVKGGDGKGRTGGGAAIEVSVESSLTIEGFGTLVATGGNAANGETGFDGANGWAHENGDDEGWGGFGGRGGDGGGGAGAGIGGSGGSGGERGSGGDSVLSENGNPDDFIDGQNGQNGQNGGDGEACGRVVIDATITTSINGGLAGSDGECGDTGIHGYYESGFFNDMSFGGGGGGGQGGKGGHAAPAIGGGGGGGAGGAGGGGGCAISNVHEDLEFTDNTDGAGGGYDRRTGKLVNPKGVYNDDDEILAVGGLAGAGGTDGKDGISGFIHIHKFDTFWQHNDTMHWHECTVRGCPIDDFTVSGINGNDLGYHVDKDGDFRCDICGWLSELDFYRSHACTDIEELAGKDCSDTVKTLVDTAKTAINAATDFAVIDAVKAYAQTAINLVKASEEATGKAISDKIKEIEELNDLIDSLNDDIDALEDENDTLKDNITKLEDDVSKAKDEIDTLGKEIDALENQADWYEDRLEAADLQLESVIASHNELAGKVRVLEAAVEALEKENEELKAGGAGDTTELEAELAAAKEELAQAKATLAERNELIADLSARLDKALKTIEELQGADGTPDTPEKPEKTPCERCGRVHNQDFFGKIACFLNRIANFFKNLF